MTTWLRYDHLTQHNYVNNRMTLKRRTDAGTFPPPYDLGPNTVAWDSRDLAELDRRIAAGITEPHPDWLRRAQERKARRPSRATTKRLSAVASGVSAT